jgi:hypothetical protein
MDSYYECKRCYYKFYQKNDIIRHLNKKKICIRILESFENYKNENENELYELSLIRIKNTKNIFCTYCNKSFYNPHNLKRHIDKICKNINNTERENKEFLDDSENKKNKEFLEESENKEFQNENNKSNVIMNNNKIDKNINIINNITDNSVINLNINLTKGFEDEWNISHIDDNIKFILLCHNMKFTSTLEKILENEVNQNVLLDNSSNKAIIFKDKKLVNVDVKDIVKKTMDKLFHQLCNFKNDIYDSNPLCINTKILDAEMKTAETKYKEFKSNKKIEETVNTYIKDIYNKKKDNTINNFSIIKKNGY